YPPALSMGSHPTQSSRSFLAAYGFARGAHHSREFEDSNNASFANAVRGLTPTLDVRPTVPRGIGCSTLPDESYAVGPHCKTLITELLPLPPWPSLRRTAHARWFSTSPARRPSGSGSKTRLGAFASHWDIRCVSCQGHRPVSRARTCRSG